MSASRDTLLVQLLDLSGLDLLQLARALGVSHRSLRLQLEAGELPGPLHPQLRQMLDQVQALPGTTPAQRRSQLLTPGPAGHSIYDTWRITTAARGQILQPTYPPL